LSRAEKEAVRNAAREKKHEGRKKDAHVGPKKMKKLFEGTTRWEGEDKGEENFKVVSDFERGELDNPRPISYQKKKSYFPEAVERVKQI